MRYTSLRRDALIQRLSTTDWLHAPATGGGPGGAVIPAAAAVVADSTFGAAYASLLPVGTPTVTLRLRLDVLDAAAIAWGPLQASAAGGHRTGAGSGLAHGAIAGGGGEVGALVTIRGVAVPPPPDGAAEPVPPSSPRPAGPVDVALGLELGDATAARDAVRPGSWRPDPWFANVVGAVHGGVSAVVAATAAARALGVPDRGLLDLDVIYLRPLACGPDVALRLEVRQRSHGRRFASVAVDLLDGQARPAALATATFALG